MYLTNALAYQVGNDIQCNHQVDDEENGWVGKYMIGLQHHIWKTVYVYKWGTSNSSRSELKEFHSEVDKAIHSLGSGDQDKHADKATPIGWKVL